MYVTVHVPFLQDITVAGVDNDISSPRHCLLCDIQAEAAAANPGGAEGGIAAAERGHLPLR